MATAVHRDAHDPAGHNRGIALALLASLLLHTPLFLSLGAWRIGSLSTTTPVLKVRIELPQEPKAEHDTSRQDTQFEMEETASRVAEPREVPVPSEVPVATVGQHGADIAPHPEMSDSSGPREYPATHDSVLAAASAPAEWRPVELDLANLPAPLADPVVATVAPAEKTALTRRLVNEARELLESNATSRQITFEDDKGEFTAVFTRQPAADDTGIERMTVEITTEHGGEHVQTSMQMKRLAFSHFTQLVDRWDQSVQLHDDEIAGRFHSNSEILLAYDRKIAPRLLGKVTTARGIRITQEDGWRPRRKIFAGGVETRAPRVRFPEVALPVADEHSTGNADVHVVRTNTRIVFHADGAYDCVELTTRTEARRWLARDRPTYIIGARDTELHVRGTVNGRVTVYSPERIVVESDLTYAHGRHTGEDADAYLGLVSDGNIEVDRAEVTGPGDLEIHAAIYARKRFVVRDVRSRGRATLFIVGSLTAGSLSETEPRYATRTEFDPRFERARPPGFPETDRYEIEAWDGRWRVAEE